VSGVTIVATSRSAVEGGRNAPGTENERYANQQLALILPTVIGRLFGLYRPQASGKRIRLEATLPIQT
jgi:hypothetical protein